MGCQARPESKTVDDGYHQHGSRNKDLVLTSLCLGTAVSRSTSRQGCTRPTRRRWTDMSRHRADNPPWCTFGKTTSLLAHGTTSSRRLGFSTLAVFGPRAAARLTFRETLLLGIGMIDRLRGTSQTKVACFQIAIGVQQQIGRFQVSVNNCHQHNRWSSTGTHSLPNGAL